MSDLAGRYRLLLRTYPPGRRRDEVLDTLLMAAQPGRKRPGIRESANLLRHGARARLGRPAGRHVVIIAVLVALFAGFAAASLANRLTWAAAPPLPDRAGLAQIRELVTPGIPATDEELTQAVFTNDGGETSWGAISYYTDHAADTRDVNAYLAGAQRRLEAGGWRVVDSWSTSPYDTATGIASNDSREIVAVNDNGLVLDLTDTFDPESADLPGGLAVDIRRTAPWWVTAATVAGGLLGIAIGWLLAGWASRRTEGNPAATSGAGIAAVVAMALLLPAIVLGTAGFVSDIVNGYTSDAGPFWRLLNPADELGPLSIPAAVTVLIAVTIAAARRRARS
jgi:hypothetical protein